MTTTQQQVLFISGAGLPAWIWDSVREDIGGVSTVATRPGADARLSDYVDAAVASAPEGEFVVVAHSSGGVIGTELAARLPERVTGLLAMSAVVPAAGGSFVSSMPLPNRWILSLVMRLSGTRPPDAAIRKGLAGGLDAATTDRLIADFVPESIGLYKDRIGAARPTCPRGYVTTSSDKELPVSLQSTFAGRLGGGFARTIESGHLPMLEKPRETAEAIGAFLAEAR